MTQKNYLKKRGMSRIKFSVPGHINTSLSFLEAMGIPKIFVFKAALELRYEKKQKDFGYINPFKLLPAADFHGYVDNKLYNKLTAEHEQTGMNKGAICVLALETILNLKK